MATDAVKFLAKSRAGGFERISDPSMAVVVDESRFL